PARSGSFTCLFSIGPLWQVKHPAPPFGADVKNNLAPRRSAGVNAPLSPARNRSQGVFRVTTVRMKVAVARTIVRLLMRLSHAPGTGADSGMHAGDKAASAGNASRKSFR